MIQHTNPQEFADRDQPLGHGAILRARTGIPTRMIVDQDEGRRGTSHGISKDLSRMDETRRQRANRDLFDRDQAVTPIEQQRMKGLALQIRESRLEMALDFGRVPNRVSPLEPDLGQPPGEFDGRSQTGCLRRPEARDRFERRTRRRSQTDESPESFECCPCDRERIPSPVASSQEEGQQFRIRQDSRAQPSQAFSRRVGPTLYSPLCPTLCSPLCSPPTRPARFV